MLILILSDYPRAVDDARAEATDRGQSPTIPDDLAPGDKVLVYRKEPSKWDGPYALVSETPHGFYVSSSNAPGRAIQLHAKTAVKRYQEGTIIESLLPARTLLCAFGMGQCCAVMRVDK